MLRLPFSFAKLSYDRHGSRTADRYARRSAETNGRNLEPRSGYRIQVIRPAISSANLCQMASMSRMGRWRRTN